MTESERGEILKDIKDGYIDDWDNLTIDELFKEIEKEHKEIQQYRAIGTVEELKELKYNGAFSGIELANIAASLAELQKYQVIGTVDQCREAVERMKGEEHE